MANIRIVVEDANTMPFVSEGVTKHYIEIDSRDYEFDQLSHGTYNKIYDWARKRGISIQAWDELERILEDTP